MFPKYRTWCEERAKTWISKHQITDYSNKDYPIIECTLRALCRTLNDKTTHLTIIELTMWPCVCGNRFIKRLMSPSPKSQVMFASAFSWIGDFFRIFGIHSFYATATLLNIWICMQWPDATDGGCGCGQWEHSKHIASQEPLKGRC